MPNLKLTKRIVENLPLSAQGQVIYWDTELSAFGVVVGKTSKSYVVQRRLLGKTVRVTIGKHEPWVPDTARQRAREILIELSKGVNPIQAQRALKRRGTTLKQIHETFLIEKEGRLAPRTLRNYKDFMANHLFDWLNKPLRDVTSEMVVERHRRISKSSGKYAANHALKYLQTLYNYALIEDDGLRNPVIVLKQKKLWHLKGRRTTVIRERDLSDWYAAVLSLQNCAMRDCLRLLLFTGLRKTEAFQLEWKNVNLDEATIFIPHTKNKKPLKLPISSYVRNMLNERKKQSENDVWVFPGESKKGHITGLKRATVSVKKYSNISFMPHDLRRTFITIAETSGAPYYTLKRLLNHSNGSDVTGGYIVTDIQQLRETVEKISMKIEALISRDAKLNTY